MSRWPAIVIGAVTAGVLALAGCAGGQVGTAGSHAATSSGTAAARDASPPGVVDLQSSALVPFTGESVALTVQATAGQGSPQWLRLATARVAFGDGTTATVTGRCTGTPLPSPRAGLRVRHVYRRAGVVSPRVTAATLCGARTISAALAGASVALRVLPTAPAASASWPQCSQSHVSISATSTGAGLGHVGVLFTVRNTSSASCRLNGYPELQLLGGGGHALPTTVVRAVGGAYLFPAVVPHWVALPSGAAGSFDLQYGDNPVGAAASEPYATACPAATRVAVTLPHARGQSVVPANMAPCGGQVIVSPVVPGAQWLTP